MRGVLRRFYCPAPRQAHIYFRGGLETSERQTSSVSILFFLLSNGVCGKGVLMGHYFVILLGVSCHLQTDRTRRSRSDFGCMHICLSAISTKHILAAALLD